MLHLLYTLKNFKDFWSLRGKLKIHLIEGTKMFNSYRRCIAFFTFVFFVLTQAVTPMPQVHAQVIDQKEVKAAPEFQLNIPSDLGTIESISSGNGPALIHIQTAHGNYEAQKKIQGILHYLKDQYGYKTLFIEGSDFKLDPEMLRFFPGYMDKTMEVNDELTRKAIVKGPELFLLEESEASAYGIENADAYRANLAAFRAVLTQREQTEKFIADMDLQIERLTSPYLSKDLRSFLKRVEMYELNQLPLDTWFAELKAAAAKYLEMDLANPSQQIEWPMMVRVFTLRAIEAKMDMVAYKKESEKFLTDIKSRLANPALYSRIEKLLASPLSHHRLPDPETGLLFEELVAGLPQDFKFTDYPQTTSFIAHLVLQSELKSDLLVEEVERLTDKIQDMLATSSEEKQILDFLKSHRLMKKLFALELTPREYEKIIKPISDQGSWMLEQDQKSNIQHPTSIFNLRPSTLIQKLSSLNGTKRVKDVEFANIDQVDALFDKALEFYAGTKKRDEAMLKNIVQKMTELSSNPSSALSGPESGPRASRPVLPGAVVITGGFHSDPFRQFFSAKDFNYALITPKITEAAGKDAYLKVMLGKLPFFPSAAESVSAAGPMDEIVGITGAQAAFNILTDEVSGTTTVVAKYPEEPGLVTTFNDSPAARNLGVVMEDGPAEIAVSGTDAGQFERFARELGLNTDAMVWTKVPGNKVSVSPTAAIGTPRFERKATTGPVNRLEQVGVVRQSRRVIAGGGDDEELAAVTAARMEQRFTQQQIAQAVSRAKGQPLPLGDFLLDKGVQAPEVSKRELDIAIQFDATGGNREVKVNTARLRERGTKINSFADLDQYLATLPAAQNGPVTTIKGAKSIDVKPAGVARLEARGSAEGVLPPTSDDPQVLADYLWQTHIPGQFGETRNEVAGQIVKRQFESASQTLGWLLAQLHELDDREHEAVAAVDFVRLRNVQAKIAGRRNELRAEQIQQIEQIGTGVEGQNHMVVDRIMASLRQGNVDGALATLEHAMTQDSHIYESAKDMTALERMRAAIDKMRAEARRNLRTREWSDIAQGGPLAGATAVSQRGPLTWRPPVRPSVFTPDPDKELPAAMMPGYRGETRAVADLPVHFQSNDLYAGWVNAADGNTYWAAILKTNGGQRYVAITHNFTPAEAPKPHLQAGRLESLFDPQATRYEIDDLPVLDRRWLESDATPDDVRRLLGQIVPALPADINEAPAVLGQIPQMVGDLHQAAPAGVPAQPDRRREMRVNVNERQAEALRRAVNRLASEMGPLYQPSALAEPREPNQSGQERVVAAMSISDPVGNGAVGVDTPGLNNLTIKFILVDEASGQPFARISVERTHSGFPGASSKTFADNPWPEALQSLLGQQAPGDGEGITLQQLLASWRNAQLILELARIAAPAAGEDFVRNLALAGGAIRDSRYRDAYVLLQQYQDRDDALDHVLLQLLLLIPRAEVGDSSIHSSALGSHVPVGKTYQGYMKLNGKISAVIVHKTDDNKLIYAYEAPEQDVAGKRKFWLGVSTQTNQFVEVPPANAVYLPDYASDSIFFRVAGAGVSTIAQKVTGAQMDDEIALTSHGEPAWKAAVDNILPVRNEMRSSLSQHELEAQFRSITYYTGDVIVGIDRHWTAMKKESAGDVIALTYNKTRMLPPSFQLWLAAPDEILRPGSSASSPLSLTTDEQRWLMATATDDELQNLLNRIETALAQPDATYHTVAPQVPDMIALVRAKSALAAIPQLPGPNGGRLQALRQVETNDLLVLAQQLRDADPMVNTLPDRGAELVRGAMDNATRIIRNATTSKLLQAIINRTAELNRQVVDRTTVDANIHVFGKWAQEIQAQITNALDQQIPNPEAVEAAYQRAQYFVLGHQAYIPDEDKPQVPLIAPNADRWKNYMLDINQATSIDGIEDGAMTVLEMGLHQIIRLRLPNEFISQADEKRGAFEFVGTVPDRRDVIISNLKPGTTITGEDGLQLTYHGTAGSNVWISISRVKSRGFEAYRDGLFNPIFFDGPIGSQNATEFPNPKRLTNTRNAYEKGADGKWRLRDLGAERGASNDYIVYKFNPDEGQRLERARAMFQEKLIDRLQKVNGVKKDGIQVDWSSADRAHVMILAFKEPLAFLPANLQDTHIALDAEARRKINAFLKEQFDGVERPPVLVSLGYAVGADGGMIELFYDPSAEDLTSLKLPAPGVPIIPPDKTKIGEYLGLRQDLMEKIASPEVLNDPDNKIIAPRSSLVTLTVGRILDIEYEGADAVIAAAKAEVLQIYQELMREFQSAWNENGDRFAIDRALWVSDRKWNFGGDQAGVIQHGEYSIGKRDELRNVLAEPVIDSRAVTGVASSAVTPTVSLPAAYGLNATAMTTWNVADWAVVTTPQFALDNPPLQNSLDASRKLSAGILRLALSNAIVRMLQLAAAAGASIAAFVDTIGARLGTKLAVAAPADDAKQQFERMTQANAQIRLAQPESATFTGDGVFAYYGAVLEDLLSDPVALYNFLTDFEGAAFEKEAIVMAMDREIFVAKASQSIENAPPVSKRGKPGLRQVEKAKALALLDNPAWLESVIFFEAPERDDLDGFRAIQKYVARNLKRVGVTVAHPRMDAAPIAGAVNIAVDLRDLDRTPRTRTGLLSSWHRDALKLAVQAKGAANAEDRKRLVIDALGKETFAHVSYTVAVGGLFYFDDVSGYVAFNWEAAKLISAAA
jgi:hypothetical protein